MPEAVFLTPNEYHTISRIGRTKKKTYQRIDGMASENDGARSLRRRGGAVGRHHWHRRRAREPSPSSHAPRTPRRGVTHAPAAALTLFMMSTKRSRAGVISWVCIVFTCASWKKIMSPYFRSGLSSLSSWLMFFMPEL